MPTQTERNFHTEIPYLLNMYAAILEAVATSPDQVLFLKDLLYQRHVVFKDLSPVPGEGDIVYRVLKLIFFQYLQMDSDKAISLT
jgi:hypothetical protein